MKKLLLIFAITAATATGLMAQAQDQVITVGATLYQPITIDLVDDTNINFGTIGASGLTDASTISLDPETTEVTGSGFGQFFAQGTPTIAEITIEGAEDAEITVEISDADNGFALANGPLNILFKPSAFNDGDAFDAEELQNGLTLDLTDGTQTVYFGGVISDLAINTATDPDPAVWILKTGTFSGSITVSVSYN